MDLLKLMEERYSVRDYQDRPVEDEKIEKILRAAQVAPTAANRQPVRVYMLSSDGALAKIRSLTRCAFNAPVVFMLAYDKEQDWKNSREPGVHSGQQDVSIVATHMMLEAWSLGIGSCWVNAFPNTEAERAFGLPERERVVLLMPMGYAAPGAEPSAMHFSNKSVEEMVERL